MAVSLFAVGALGAPSIAATYPPGPGDDVACAVDRSTVTSGETVLLECDNFAAGSAVTVTDEVAQQSSSLASPTAGADGSISLTLTLSTVGTHMLTASGTNVAGAADEDTVQVRVVSGSTDAGGGPSDDSGGLAFTGNDLALPGLALGLGLVVVGTGVTAAARRRRTVA